MTFSCAIPTMLARPIREIFKMISFSPGPSSLNFPLNTIKAMACARAGSAGMPGKIGGRSLIFSLVQPVGTGCIFGFYN